MSKFLYFLIIGLALLSCQKEDDVLIPEEIAVNFTNVDPRLWEFYASFEEEAARRGIEYNLNDLHIEGKIIELHQGNVAGICSYNSNQPNLVRIDAVFWNNSSYLLKEMIVFHELGHCVINRNHYEAANANGFCISIMRSGIEDCRDNYTTTNRETYLDELFLNRVNLISR